MFRFQALIVAVISNSVIQVVTFINKHNDLLLFLFQATIWVFTLVYYSVKIFKTLKQKN